MCTDCTRLDCTVLGVTVLGVTVGMYVCTLCRYVCERGEFFSLRKGRVRSLYILFLFSFSFLFFCPPPSSLLIYFVVGSFGLGRCYMLHVGTS